LFSNEVGMGSAPKSLPWHTNLTIIITGYVNSLVCITFLICTATPCDLLLVRWERVKQVSAWLNRHWQHTSAAQGGIWIGGLLIFLLRVHPPYRPNYSYDRKCMTYLMGKQRDFIAILGTRNDSIGGIRKVPMVFNVAELANLGLMGPLTWLRFLMLLWKPWLKLQKDNIFFQLKTHTRFSTSATIPRSTRWHWSKVWDEKSEI